MFTALKHILCCSVFVLCIVPLNSQNTGSDYIPTQLISYGLDAPGRMAIDADDHVYVTNTIQNNIIKYDAQGNYMATIATDFKPISLAIDKNNNLFVGDQITGNIYKLASNGSKSIFYSGAKQPNAMVFGLQNILYVVDSQLKNVIGLDGSGHVVSNFTSGNFVFPTGIAYDKHNNHFIVSEHGGIGEDVQYCYSGQWNVSSYGPVTTVYILDGDGNLINQFGCFGTKDGEFQRIMGVSMGTCGNIYVVDPYLGRVNVYDDHGNYLTKFGFQGDGQGELNLPIDIVFTSDNRAFVSSLNKGAIDIFYITDTLPTATITSEDQIICADATGLVDIHFTGNGPWSFTYTVDKLNPITMSADASPFSFEVSEAGLYEITALTDGNNVAGACFTGSTSITVIDPPTATILTNDFSKCQDENLGVDVQFTGTSPWVFTYTIDGLNPTELTSTTNSYTIPAEQSGVYEIITLADASCTGDTFLGNTSVTIYPLPTATLVNEFRYARTNPGEVTDFVIALTGTAPWTMTILKDEIEEYTIDTTDSLFTFSISEESTYEIMSVADLNCSNNSWQCFFNLTFNDVVIPTASILSENIEMCSGAAEVIAIEFTGASPWTFTYTIDGIFAGELTTAENPYQLPASSPGVYELSSLTDGLNTPGTFSGAALVMEHPVPILDLGPDVDICEGGSTHTLDAGLFDSYLWSDGSTGRTLEVSAAGTYSVTVMNAYGCSATDFVNVTVHSFVNSDFYYDVNRFEVQFVSNANEADAHYWEFGDKTTSTEENPIHTYSRKGDYTVKYTASNAYCGSIQVSKVISVGSNTESDVVMIYPNPSYGEFTIKITPIAPITSNLSIVINSTSGQTIYSEVFNPNYITQYNGSMYIPVNIESFDKGIYIVYINAGTFAEQEKLVLKD